MNQVRPSIPNYAYRNEFLFASSPGQISIADILWIQAATIEVLLLVSWLGWGWRGLDWAAPIDTSREAADSVAGESNQQEAAPLARCGLVLACFEILMMQPISEPIYQLLLPLQRIQFPWRWLGPTWFGALFWLSSPAALPHTQSQSSSTLLRGAWLRAITLTAVLWGDCSAVFERTFWATTHWSWSDARSIGCWLAIHWCLSQTDWPPCPPRANCRSGLWPWEMAASPSPGCPTTHQRGSGKARGCVECRPSGCRPGRNKPGRLSWGREPLKKQAKALGLDLPNWLNMGRNSG